MYVLHICLHVFCMCESWCVLAAVCIRGSKDTSGVSPHLYLWQFATAYARLTGPQESSDAPVSTCPLGLRALKLQAHAVTCLVWTLELWTQVLTLTWQTLSQLSRFLSLQLAFVGFEMFHMQPWLTCTSCVDQTSLQLLEIHMLLLPEHWDLKVFTMMPGLFRLFKEKNED